MVRPADLPNFDKPPVDEVAIGMHFAPIPGFNDVHVFQYWNDRKDRYPSIEQKDRLHFLEGDPSQPLSPIPATRVFAIQNPGSQRTWLSTADETYLLQIQNDAFYQNWRRRTDPYPNFENIVQRFLTAWNEYQDHTAGAALETPRVTVVEVSYINWIPDIEMSQFLRASRLVDLSGRGVAVSPEHQVIQAVYPIRVSGIPVGRLVVDCQPAYRGTADDWAAGCQFNLTVRRRIAQGEQWSESILFESEEVIVQAFFDLTTDYAHLHWGERK